MKDGCRPEERWPAGNHFLPDVVGMQDAYLRRSMGPVIEVFSAPEEVSLVAASRIADFIQANPSGALGTATGETMRRPYADLVKVLAERDVSGRSLSYFGLDEYYPAPKGSESFRSFMNEQLFIPFGVPLEPIDGSKYGRTHLPSIQIATERQIMQYCAGYEDRIRAAGGIGLQLLGIGKNGHIGFNEPGSEADSRTRLVTLSPSTREANAPHFGDIAHVPNQAITVGLGTIMEANRVLLIATGDGKAEAVFRAFCRPPHLDVPASILQQHSSVSVLIDQAAASRLSAEVRRRAIYHT